MLTVVAIAFHRRGIVVKIHRGLGCAQTLKNLYMNTTIHLRGDRASQLAFNYYTLLDSVRLDGLKLWIIAMLV